MAVFESRFRPDMEEADAVQLVRDAIRAGIFNDLGSGSNVDIHVIRKGGESERFRTYEVAAGHASTYKAQYPRPNKLTISKGTTFVIEEKFTPHTQVPTFEPISNSGSSSMDI
jgi:20S proteasome subunit beta 2